MCLCSVYAEKAGNGKSGKQWGEVYNASFVCEPMADPKLCEIGSRFSSAEEETPACLILCVATHALRYKPFNLSLPFIFIRFLFLSRPLPRNPVSPLATSTYSLVSHSTLDKDITSAVYISEEHSLTSPHNLPLNHIYFYTDSSIQGSTG